MGDPHRNRPFPKGVLYASGALILFTLALTYVGKTTGIGTVDDPATGAIQTLRLRFEDQPNGDVVARSVDGEILGVFPSGDDGFVRGLLRGLNRDRKLEDVDRDLPFELTLWSGGRLSLTDPSTGRSVELNAFGRTNVEPFAQLFSGLERGEP